MKNKMSMSEAGKLGGIKGGEIEKQKKLKRIEEFNKNPSKCDHCDKSLPYEKRHNKFCNHSCSSSNHKGIVRNGVSRKKDCDQCGKETSNPKFCDAKCHRDWEWDNITLPRVLSGEGGARTIKKYLIIENGNTCSSCGITEWNGENIVMDLDHIDGNSENNDLENTRLLCPNCHSQTETYKGRNVGNGRHSRRERYKEGKSY